MQEMLPVSEDVGLSTSIQPHRDFDFPKDGHLLVTTPSYIYAWDYLGIHTLFQSSKHGIIAAREAPNGSGVLAVADKHVVVLHDTQHGQEKSWGLGAEEDEVRQLAYASDARSLYLSTSLTPDIQRYSTEQSRLLDPARAHASPPVALAISPTGRCMVSASDSPPVVYLRNLEHNGSLVLIEPRASQAAVAVAVFHPERPNIFLLAFRDGVAAAYDATKILRSGKGLTSDQGSVDKSEIGHLSCLHRAASNGGRSAAITDAAFLPGFKSRVVTVGNDGRCRIIDFADGGVTLRTWHAKSPVTSVSVFATKLDLNARRRGSGSIPAHIIGGPTSTDSLIAIGLADGEIFIFNSVGLLLSQRTIGSTGERIISVEWIKGLSPRPVKLVEMEAGQATLAESQEGQPCMAVQTSALQSEAIQRMGSNPALPCVQESIKRQTARVSPNRRKTLSELPRKFTIHPDEVETHRTVLRTPLRDAEKMRRMTTGDFKDLFSSNRVDNEDVDVGASPSRVTSPPRSRPTITSQTFVRSPEPGDPMYYDTMSRRRNLALFPSTDSKPETATSHQPTNNETVSHLSRPVKRATFTVNSIQSAHRRTSSKLASATIHEVERFSSGPQVLAPSPINCALQSTQSTPNLYSDTPNAAHFPQRRRKNRFLHRPKDHIETDADSETAREAYEDFHKRRHWPTDSNQDSSAGGGDGCVSSNLRRRTPRTRDLQAVAVEQPPTRKVSRSRKASKGITSNIGNRMTDATKPPAQPLPAIDGSTEEDIFVTADTHVTSSGTFSPSSKDVCSLFPRSSSLSPRKAGRSKARVNKLPVIDTSGRHKPTASSEHVKKQSKSPWARARVLREIENGSGNYRSWFKVKNTKHLTLLSEQDDRGQTTRQPRNVAPVVQPMLDLCCWRRRWRGCAKIYWQSKRS